MGVTAAARDEQKSDRTRAGMIPGQLPIGLLLILISWPLAWSGTPTWSEHTFFPLWLGYILT
ncbi:MAG: hypothetical protein M3411_00380, partial [Chloroflexota bacterium]|nr:hypothetical protein [Chloroflexota bacterium]